MKKLFSGMMLGGVLLLATGCNNSPEQKSALPVYPVPAPVAVDKLDADNKAILDAFLKHAHTEVRKLTREKLAEETKPEMYCWVACPNLLMSLRAYELTGDASYLDDFVFGMENLRSLMKPDKEGFLGLRGVPIPGLRHSDYPDTVIDEIQTTFRVVDVLSQFVELARRAGKYDSLSTVYIDLATNHLVKKWDVRGYYMDLGKTGATYCWNKAYKPSKAGQTLPHEKMSMVINGLLSLYRVSGDDAIMTKAVKLGTRLKNLMTLEKEGHYTWGYWDPAGKWDLKAGDPTKWRHWIGNEPKGAWYAVTVGSAVNLYRHGVVFTAEDIARFVKTQTEVCWNGDMEKPAFVTVLGNKGMGKARFISHSLAPHNAKVAEFLYTGARVTERLKKLDSAWRSGVLASRWLQGKYITMQLAAKDKQYNRAAGEQFAAKPENKKLLADLNVTVTTESYRSPKVPGDEAFLK